MTSQETDAHLQVHEEVVVEVEPHEVGEALNTMDTTQSVAPSVEAGDLGGGGRGEGGRGGGGERGCVEIFFVFIFWLISFFS